MILTTPWTPNHQTLRYGACLYTNTNAWNMSLLAGSSLWEWHLGTKQLKSLIQLFESVWKGLLEVKPFWFWYNSTSTVRYNIHISSQFSTPYFFLNYAFKSAFSINWNMSIDGELRDVAPLSRVPSISPVANWMSMTWTVMRRDVLKGFRILKVHFCFDKHIFWVF